MTMAMWRRGDNCGRGRAHTRAVSMGALFSLALVLTLISTVVAVDRSKFRTCAQTQFCSKHRFGAHAAFEVAPTSVHQEGDVIHFDLQDGAAASASSQLLQGRLQFVLDAATSQTPAVRLHVTEKWADPTDPKKRWENEDVLMPAALSTRGLRAVSGVDSGVAALASLDDSAVRIFTLAAKENAAEEVMVALRMNPFGVDVYLNQEKVMSTNSDQQFYYEVRRDRDSGGDVSPEENTADTAAAEDIHEGKTIVDYGEDGLAIYSDGTTQKKAEVEVETSSVSAPSSTEGWEESFGGHTDKKRFGPSSLGLDIAFHGHNRGLYGIPEHASDFLLKDTVASEETDTDGRPKVFSDPYRLYNLDVFEYELDETMTLYGAIPLLVAPDATSTVGVFWHNPSETFVDIETKSDGSKKSRWLSESGVLDLFFLVGPRPEEFFSQYTALTGRAQMPPMFAIGYHQCRWNYKNEDDVNRVNAGFDEHLIPMDVLWLDIEHTRGKRYFTWDEHAFATPLAMQERVARVGRKMVTIVDPHIKVDTEYFVHQEATEAGVYVKNEQGGDFSGWCWPGDSSYVDFTSPRARRWWSALFRYEKYEGSSSELYTWNDMNEPSVFNGPEVSMRKTCLNLDDVEHREWHNLYGMYLQQATMEGQLLRQLPESEAALLTAATGDASSHVVPPALPSRSELKRSFVLSRAFFAGSQRYGAVWTGDNTATWGHLQYATKMLLSMSVAGLTFVGADIGGFFGSPDAELLTRWYQSAALQPFFRSHAHHDSPRREPWVFGEPTTSRLRDAIRERYALLPYLYTLFHTCSTDGLPVMRPLWMHFPLNARSFTEEDEFLLGRDILVKPITSAGVTETAVFLPGSADLDVWYDLHQGYQRFVGGTTYEGVAAPIEFTPEFQRGGSIVPRKNRVRRSSALMRNDPYTLVVALNAQLEAEGALYLDDGETFAFVEEAAFMRVAFTASREAMSARVLHSGVASTAWIERIEIVGFQGKPPVEAVLVDAESGAMVERTLETLYDVTRDVLVIRKPAVLVTDAWTIRFKEAAAATVM